MGFEILDISGDIGLRVSGKDIKEVFINAAKGLYSLITDPSSVRPERALTIEVKDDNLEGLLVSFLNELIFQFDTYGFIGSSISIEGNMEDHFKLTPPTSATFLWLKAIIMGEAFDPNRHERGLLVKAATYHNLKIFKNGDMWQAEVIFDI
jgi:SHS2 domain-containing protein